MNYSQLREVQLIELEILKEVARICNKHEIEYFLDSGTALGAVRHEGFIPWDDDIDIGMTRDNYDRFLRIASQELSDGFFLQTNETDKKAPYIFAKVRKNGTIFLKWNKRNIDMHHGIFIDVFPYDNVPDDEKEREKYQKRCRILYRFYLIRSIPDRTVQPEKSIKWVTVAIIRRVLHYLSKVIPVSIIKKITDNMFRKYNGIETKCLTCHMFSKVCVFNRKDLFPLRQIRFEDGFFTVVNNVEKYLTLIYGDYKQLPPVEKRKGHRPYKLKC